MIDRLAGVVGAAAVLVALAIVWAARSSLDRTIYVSQLGAEGEPTAGAFMAAMLLIAAGGALIGWAARGIRARARILSLWIPAVTLWASSASFAVASQVTCTAGCPLPVSPGFFSLQDLVHISFAVAGFALACWAMLQCAAAAGHRVLARVSLAASLSVALIASAGGLMSVFDFHRGIGAWLEYAAMTIGLLWVAALGLILALRRAPESAALPPQRDEQLVGE